VPGGWVVRCCGCECLLTLGPFGHGAAKPAFSEAEADGQRLYFCEPCTRSLYVFVTVAEAAEPSPSPRVVA